MAVSETTFSDNDAVLDRARQQPEPSWAVFPFSRSSAVGWWIKRLLWACLLTVICAIAALALEVVPIDDPRVPGGLIGLLGGWVALLSLGPARALLGAGNNLLVVTDDRVVWREGGRVQAHPLAGLTEVKERITAGRGLQHEIELIYDGRPYLFLDHRRFGPPDAIAAAVAERSGARRAARHGRDYEIV